MFLSGVQFRFRLDSRLKHAGMTVFGKKISLTQQAAGKIRPAEIKKARYDDKFEPRLHQDGDTLHGHSKSHREKKLHVPGAQCWPSGP